MQTDPGLWTAPLTMQLMNHPPFLNSLPRE